MKDKDISSIEQFPERVVAILDEGVQDMDAGTRSRLYDARRQALAARHAQHVGGGALALRAHPAVWGMGLAAILLLGVWLAMQQPGPQRPALPDTSELDIQLLTGELPPQVFADWSLVTQENVEAVCLTES